MTQDSPQIVIPPTSAAVPFHGYDLPLAPPFVTVSALVQALRSRWRLWMMTALAGLTTAVALTMAFAPPYSATTTLLLRHSSEVDPARAMNTDVELLKTRTVAQAVIDRLSLHVSPDELISHYMPTMLSDRVLEITVDGPTADQAVRRAEALASEFLRFRREEMERQSQVVVQVLEERKATLTAELVGLTQRINSLATGSNASISANPIARRTAVSAELNQLSQRIDEIRLDTTSTVANSRVVDPAVGAGRPLLKTMTRNIPAGIVGGLAVGAGWVVVAEVVSDRVRRRRDVMLLLGAPVAVSTRPLRGPLRAQRRRFRQHLVSPRRDVSRVVHHLRRVLSTSETVTPSVVAVSVGSERPAALFIASTAVDLVHEGKNVLVVDLSRRSALAAIFNVSPRKTSALRFEGIASTLWVAFPSAPSQEAREHEGLELDVKPDLVLTLAALDPAIGAWHLVRWATTAVAVVTAGRATSTALRSTELMIRAAGLKLVSAVLTGADRNDESPGVLDHWPQGPSRRESASLLGTN